MRLSKSLGQVFLKDKHYIEKILSVLDIDGKEVLEIGPGEGVMTRHLINRAQFLYCVELDHRFCEYLRGQFGERQNIEIVHNDILKYSLCALKKQLIVFGNIPYQISNHLIHYFIDNRRFITTAYITVQKEFADKLIAQSSTKAYGFLSCCIQYYADVKKLFDIPAKAFCPCPKVDSSFVKMQFFSVDAHNTPSVNENALFATIRKAFSARRKKISNSLNIPKEKYAFLADCGISCDARAENISLEQYKILAHIVYPQT